MKIEIIVKRLVRREGVARSSTIGFFGINDV
jgi:hypothetical protein